MTMLNKMAYVVEKDKLIYDFSHPLDGMNFTVKIEADTNGVIQRGELLDIAEDGTYTVHKEAGVPCAIVSENAEYAADDTEIIVSAYISGTFRKSEIKAELDTAEVEELRSKGIYLK